MMQFLIIANQLIFRKLPAIDGKLAGLVAVTSKDPLTTVSLS